MSTLHTYGYATCRLLGHSWHHVPSDWTPTFGAPMTVRCERCDMERRDTVNRNTGDILSRRYTYPKGYRFDGEDDRPKRTDFRLAWLHDEVDKVREARRARAS